MGPRGWGASSTDDGQIELWGTTQGTHVFRDRMAAILRMDSSKIRVTQSEMGGGFGSFDDSKPASVQWVSALHEAGMLTIPAGSSVVRFLPPLNLTQQEAQAGLDLFEQTIQKITA